MSTLIYYYYDDDHDDDHDDGNDDDVLIGICFIYISYIYNDNVFMVFPFLISPLKIPIPCAFPKLNP